MHNDGEWDLFGRNQVQRLVENARSLVGRGVVERFNRTGVISVMRSWWTKLVVLGHVALEWPSIQKALCSKFSPL